MHATPLNFEEVLDKFYIQGQYEMMLLFVSSLDCYDKNILKEVVDNAQRIDSITGDRICFFYFIKNASDSMNEKLTRWIKDLHDFGPLYGEGVQVTMETANDICRHFGILRSDLPAFILVSKDRCEKPLVLSVHKYDDLESFLTPLNTLHAYIYDYKHIVSRYDNEGFVLPQHELDYIREKCIDKLNFCLNSDEGERIIEYLSYNRGYFKAVSTIWELVSSCSVRIAGIIENVRKQIQEHGFDVFISCKSEDYASARELYNYLEHNGFKPFLADISIKEVGIDQYTLLIGEVIGVCQNMIVFASNPDYIKTSYVTAEWEAFVNDINSGHKPNGKLVTILTPDIEVRSLPVWLRNKQSFTTENYKKHLADFLKGTENRRLQELRHRLHEAYYKYTRIHPRYMYRELKDMYEKYIQRIDTDERYFKLRLMELETSHNYSDFELLQRRIEDTLKEWEEAYVNMMCAFEEMEKCEDYLWHQVITAHSEEAIKFYLEKFPDGAYAQEALIQLNIGSDAITNSDTKGIANGDVTHYAAHPEDPTAWTNTKTFEPKVPHIKTESESTVNIWRRLFKRREPAYDVYSSVFAPAEVKRKSHLLIQVYLH
jgi:hypothetical protein